MRTVVWTACLALTLPVAAATIPSPEEVFGHQVGADRKLIPYPDVLDYLRTVDEASDRVSIEEGYESTLGNPMPVVVLTSPANQKRLGEYREMARQLAKPETGTRGTTSRLVERARAIALVTCTIHGTEVGSTQMTTEFVHEFATTEDPERLAWMDEVILLLMPSINPDGQVMIIDWYNQWVGTDFEGGRMPWLYHHYVGHDNNRDFYALTQKESQNVNDLLYHRWFPQVFLDEHQMGSTGPRMFVPPQADPLDEEIHSLVFRQADVIGTNMSRRLEEAGKRGVGHNMIFDSYWPGATRNTAWWKNVTGLLTEVASARIATPIYIDPGELRGGGKGFPSYRRRSNYPSPWSGGWWRLRDIVEYELVATWAFLEAVAEDRHHILRNVDRMARTAIARGRAEPPYAFIVPPSQHDEVAARRLVDLLLRHGVEVTRATGPLEVGYATYPPGTIVIPAAQPYRPFLLTMLRPQRYPEVEPYTDGPIIAPYDVTSWSLPIAMGVDVVEAERPVEGTVESIDEAAWARRATRVKGRPDGWLIPAGAASVYTAINRLLADGTPVRRVVEAGGGAGIGDVWLDTDDIDAATLSSLADELHLPTVEVAGTQPRTREVRAQRVGLYKPWVASMDEGWTRFVLEQYDFPMVNLANEDLRSGEFTEVADVVLFPDVDKDVIASGKPRSREGRYRWWTPLPPRWAGGIDTWPTADGTEATTRQTDRGGARIKHWVEQQGGTVVALDSATAYFIELFGLPVHDVLAEVERDRFDCPGSMLRILMDTTHPLAWGLRSEEAAYFARSPAFRTRLPGPRIDRRVVARYPRDAKDILVSGYLEGGELLERRAAVVDLQVGAGRVVLIGFRAQHRAQPLRTFKLLFNALYELAPAPATEDRR
jgi:hypothetical protein